jgi:hypothetical protein
MWTNLFTIDAIADIGLSEQLGFLVNGNDRVIVCGPNGVSREVCYRDSLHGTAESSSALVWSSGNFSLLKKIVPLVSRRYNTWAQIEKDYNDVVYNLVQRRLERHLKGEKLNDFFTFLMEDKKGSTHNLELGEIKAKVGHYSNRDDELFVPPSTKSCKAPLPAERVILSAPAANDRNRCKRRNRFLRLSTSPPLLPRRP